MNTKVARTVRAWSGILAAAGLLVVGGCRAQEAPEGVSGDRGGEPVVVLELAPGPRRFLPAVSPHRVGGAGGSGPRSLAVAENGSVYLLDSVRGALLEYAHGECKSVVDLPFLSLSGYDEDARDLLLHGGTFYARNWCWECEFDRSGAIRRLLPARVEGQTIYPVPRPECTVPVAGEGEVVDTYVTAAGAAYALKWIHTPSFLSRVVVERLAPADRAAAPVAPVPQAMRPEAFGLPVPSAVRIACPWWPRIEVTDPIFLNNLWHILGTFRPTEAPEWEATPHFRLTAVFGSPDAAQTLTLYQGWELLSVGGRWYRGLGHGVSALLASAMYTPENLAALFGADVRVTIPDLPGVEQRLGEEEQRACLELLRQAFRAGWWEPPQPLEAPFPRYAVVVKGPDWQAVLEFAGEDYLYVMHGNLVRHGAICVPRELFGLVAGWLPVPPCPADELPYLYRATELWLGERGSGTPLHHWKNSVVRSLLGVAPAGHEESGTLTLTFIVEGEARPVFVAPDGFTYAGRRYDRRGLAWLARLQAVP